MATLWGILVISMFSATLSFDILEDRDRYSYQVEYGEAISTHYMMLVYNDNDDESRGSRLIRAAAKTKAPAKSKTSSSSSKRVKLNKISQKYWRELLDCCEPPEFMTRASRNTCYPKFKTFKGQVTVGPPRIPTIEPFNRTCLVQCAFMKEGLIDSKNGLLSIPGIDAKIKAMMGQNPKWSVAIQRSYDSCNAQYTSLINTELTCKSGAAEWAQCLVKFMVANCPEEEKKSTHSGCFEKIATIRSKLKVKAAPEAKTTVASVTNATDTTAAVTASSAAAAAT